MEARSLFDLSLYTRRSSRLKGSDAAPLDGRSSLPAVCVRRLSLAPLVSPLSCLASSPTSDNLAVNPRHSRIEEYTAELAEDGSPARSPAHDDDDDAAGSVSARSTGEPTRL